MKDKLIEPTETGVIDPSQYGDFGGAGEADSETIPYFQLLQALSDAEKKDAFGEGSLILMPDEVVCASGKGGVMVAVCVFMWKSWQMTRDKNDQDGHWLADETFDPAHKIALRANDWADRKTGETKFGGRTEPYGDGLEYTFLSAYHFALIVKGGEGDGLFGVLTSSKSTAKTGRAHFNGLKRRAGRPSAPLPCFSHGTNVVIRTEPVPDGKGKGADWIYDLKVGEPTLERDWGGYAEAYRAAKSGYEAKKAEIEAKHAAQVQGS